MRNRVGHVALLIGLCACVGACAAQTTTIHLKPTSTPTAVVITDTPTPEGPYPTPTAWNTFTYPITSIFTLAYPSGWSYAPVMLDTVIFDSQVESPPLPRPRIELVLSAYFDHGDISNLCARHPTMTMAGLPTTQSFEHDTIGRPYYEWDAANSAIGLRVTFTISLGAGHLDDYRAIYTYIVSSVMVADQYRNAQPCAAG